MHTKLYRHKALFYETVDILCCILVTQDDVFTLRRWSAICPLAPLAFLSKQTSHTYTETHQHTYFKIKLDTKTQRAQNMIKLIWVERSPEVEKSSSNKPCGVFLLFVLLSEMQTQLKVSSIPVSGSIQGPSSRIDIYPFPICEPSIAHRCLPGQPLNHRPPLSHWAHGRRGRSRSDGRGDVAGWFAGAAWNYCRPTSASWKYHQNLLSFRMHGWVPAAALQLVARFDFFSSSTFVLFAFPF